MPRPEALSTDLFRFGVRQPCCRFRTAKRKHGLRISEWVPVSMRKERNLCRVRGWSPDHLYGLNAVPWGSVRRAASQSLRSLTPFRELAQPAKLRRYAQNGLAASRPTPDTTVKTPFSPFLTAPAIPRRVARQQSPPPFRRISRPPFVAWPKLSEPPMPPKRKPSDAP